MIEVYVLYKCPPPFCCATYNRVQCYVNCMFVGSCVHGETVLLVALVINSHVADLTTARSYGVCLKK